MTGEFCGASLFRGFPASQRPTEARGKERHLRNIEIPGYRRGHNIPEASVEPPYGPVNFDRSATVPSRNPSYAIPHTGRCAGVASAAPHRCTSGSAVRFGRDEPPSSLRPGHGRTRLAGAGARPQCYHRGRAVKSRQPGREPCMPRVFYIAS